MKVCESHASLPSLVQRFFADWLIAQREASPHTVASYRDTFRLLLAYATRQLARQPTDLSVADIDADLVAGFLAFVEDDRKNSIRTRNVRRAAIRSFFRFVAIREPALLLHCQRVLAIPAKRQDQTDGRLPRARGGRRTARDARPVHIDRPARPEPAACRPADRTAGLGADRSEHRRRGLRSLGPAACPVPRQGTQGSGDAAARRQRQGPGSVAPGTGRRPARTIVCEQPQAALQPGWNRTDRAQVRPGWHRRPAHRWRANGVSPHTLRHYIECMTMSCNPARFWFCRQMSAAMAT